MTMRNFSHGFSLVRILFPADRADLRRCRLRKKDREIRLRQGCGRPPTHWGWKKCRKILRKSARSAFAKATADHRCIGASTSSGKKITACTLLRKSARSAGNLSGNLRETIPWISGKKIYNWNCAVKSTPNLLTFGLSK